MQNWLGYVLAVCGFLTAVIGPLIVAAAGNPLLASNLLLQKIFAVVGLVVSLAGTLKVLLLNWQQNQNAHLQAMALLAQPITKTVA